MPGPAVKLGCSPPLSGPFNPNWLFWCLRDRAGKRGGGGIEIENWFCDAALRNLVKYGASSWIIYSTIFAIIQNNITQRQFKLWTINTHIVENAPPKPGKVKYLMFSFFSTRWFNYDSGPYFIVPDSQVGECLYLPNTAVNLPRNKLTHKLCNHPYCSPLFSPPRR